MGGNQNSAPTHDALAVLHLRGSITGGTGQGDSIASRSTAKTIRKLTATDRIKAVLIRVDSPGGSATASEEVRAAMQGLAAKKPIIISMGAVAASGGYWISCVDAPIYAHHSTITGSIGVFGMKLSAKDLFTKLGLSIDTVSLDESSALFGMQRPWTAAEEQLMAKQIDDIYRRFLETAAEARDMAPEDVHEIAQGSIWTGAQAKERKLVDEIGGLVDALSALRRQAELPEDIAVEHFPKSPSFIEQLQGMASASVWQGQTGVIRHIQQGLEAQGFDLRPVSLVFQQLLGTADKQGVYVMSDVLIGLR